MACKTPKFWQKRGMISTLLLPFSWLFWLASGLRRCFIRPKTYNVPVVCVGNLLAGGSGKTPVVMALAHMLTGMGKRVFCVSRGYGGTITFPIVVDPEVHSAHVVGDEPLILARIAPTIIAKCRRKAVERAIALGAEIVLMDDGFQHPYISASTNFLVIDSHVALGNGRLLPAGPLRQTLSSGLKKADALIVLGPYEPLLDAYPSLATLPVLKADIQGDFSKLDTNTKYVAFAGIGYPDKFFHLLRSHNINLVDTIAYADHYPYTSEEINLIKNKARHLGAHLVTTEKDFVRVPARQRDRIATLPIHVQWHYVDAVLDQLKML